jgi:hypothetical protein
MKYLEVTNKNQPSSYENTAFVQQEMNSINENTFQVSLPNMLMAISLNRMGRNAVIAALTVRSAQLITIACNVAFEVCCCRIISTSNDGELNEMVIDCDSCLVNNGMWMNECMNERENGLFCDYDMCKTK